MSKSGIVATAAVIRLAPLPAAVRAGLCALALSAGWVAPAPALAGQAALAAEREYRIAPGPLAAALQQLASDADVLLSFDPALVAGRHSQGLSGRFRVGEGFSRLLAGTGLELVARAEGGYTLRRAERGADGAQVLEQVVVTDRADRESGFANTATGQTLTREQLDRVPPTSTGDIFKDIAGVTVANNRNGVGIDLNIRGMQGMGRVKVLVDGTQNSSSAWKGYAGNVDSVFVDPDLISAVTVEKGPSSGPYGSGAVGGVVQMSTLGAEDILLPGQSSGFRLRGMLGDNSGSGRYDYNDNLHASGVATPYTMEAHKGHYGGSLAAAWRGLDDKLELVAAYSQRQQGNYHAGNRGKATYRYTGGGSVNSEEALSFYRQGEEVYNTSMETTSTLLKVRVLLPQSQSLSLSINDYSSEYGEVRTAFLAPGSGGINSFYEQYKRQQGLGSTDKLTLTASYAWQPDNELWNLHANLWRAELDEVRKTGYALSSTNSQGAELWNASHFNWRWLDLSLRYGATWFSEKAAVTDMAHIPVNGQVPLIGGPQSGNWMDFPGKRETWSQFLQADVNPLPWITLQGGLRRDAYRISGNGTYGSAIPGQNPVPYDLRHEDSRLNHSLGFTLGPWAGAQFYARYSEGWRPPTIKETQTVPTNTLQPETTESLEMGVRFNRQGLLSAKDTLSLNLGWFDNRHKNYIYGVFEPINIEGAKLRGTDFSLGYDTGWLFASAGMVRYSKIEYCGVPENGIIAPTAPRSPCTNDLPRQSLGSGLTMVGVYIPPKWSRNASLGTRLLDRKLTLGLRYNAVGERGATVQYPAGISYSRQGWAPYETYDLFGNYRVSSALDFNLSVENLRDRFYIDALTNSSFVVPSPGRTAKVTATWKF